MTHLLPALSVLATLLLVAGPAAAQGPIQWSGVVDQGDSVEVVNIRGTIQAVASVDGMVHVDARPSDPSVMSVQVVEHAGGLKVCVVPAEWRGNANGRCGSGNDHRGWPSRGDADIHVDIEVSVPDGVRLSATSVSGDVRAAEIRSDVTVTVVSGRAFVESAGFPVRVTAVSGDVRLEVPANADADFQATTLSGDIDSDVPLSRRTRNARSQNGDWPFDGVGPKNVRATLGNGGAALHVTTVSGDIELRQR